MKQQSNKQSRGKKAKAKTASAKPEKQKKASAGKVKPAAKSKKPAKAPAPKKAPVSAPAASSERPAKGRQILINMLSRDDGATKKEMAAAAGWGEGAVGGTLSKIKKLIAPRNQVIVSHKGDNGKLVYKITEKAAAA